MARLPISSSHREDKKSLFLVWAGIVSPRNALWGHMGESYWKYMGILLLEA